MRRIGHSRRRCPSPAPEARPLPIKGEARREPGFFPFGCAQGFGWWKRRYPEAL